jgi:hypothetical protein
LLVDPDRGRARAQRDGGAEWTKRSAMQPGLAGCLTGDLESDHRRVTMTQGHDDRRDGIDHASRDGRREPSIADGWGVEASACRVHTIVTCRQRKLRALWVCGYVGLWVFRYSDQWFSPQSALLRPIRGIAGRARGEAGNWGISALVS